MTRVVLRIARELKDDVWSHLVRSEPGPEEAAFLFGRVEGGDERLAIVIDDWYGVPPSGYVIHSPYHIELTSDVRALVIKRAHDMGASLVEAHSHVGAWPACFSPSDFVGFRDFVPHVRWRLRKRPYAAIVVAGHTFDGLAWLNSSNEPAQIDAIESDAQVLEPTRLSLPSARRYA